MHKVQRETRTCVLPKETSGTYSFRIIQIHKAFVKHMAETSVLCHSSDSNIMDSVTIVTGTKNSTIEAEDTEEPT